MPPARAPTVTAPLKLDEVGEEVAAEPLPVPESGDEPLPVPEPEAFEAGVVPLIGQALAAARKAAKVSFAVGLMEKTIPCSQ